MIETVNTAPEWHSLSYRFLFIGEIDSGFSLARPIMVDVQPLEDGFEAKVGDDIVEFGLTKEELLRNLAAFMRSDFQSLSTLSQLSADAKRRLHWYQTHVAET